MPSLHRLCLLALVPLLLTGCGAADDATDSADTGTGTQLVETPRQNSSKKYFSLEQSSSSKSAAPQSSSAAMVKDTEPKDAMAKDAPKDVMAKDGTLQLSASSAVVYDLTKPVGQMKKEGDVHVKVTVSATEVKPGGLLTYTLVAKNNTKKALDGYSVIHSFSEDQVKVVSGNGRREGGTMQWVLTGLKPGASKTLTLSVRAVRTLALGDVIRTNTVVLYGTTVQPQTGSLEVLVVNQMPATGAASFTDPVDSAREFIKPYRP